MKNHLGPTLAAVLEERGVSQGELAERLAELGIDGASQQMVSRWIRQLDGIRPRQVFGIERALVLEPGSLSRLEGYLPVDASPVVTAEDAVRSDLTLSDDAREMLLAALAAARKFESG